MKEQILTKLANAMKTYYACSGHTKAQMNLQRIKEYKEELKKLSEPIPHDDQLLKTGIFNGEGSF
jgi:hypothetical protein